MSYKITDNGVGYSLRVVVPVGWRGFATIATDYDCTINITPSETDNGDFEKSNSWNIEVNVGTTAAPIWVTPIYIVTKPTTKASRTTAVTGGTDNFGTQTSGFSCRLVGFDGVNRGADEQNVGWVSGASSFTFNRNDNANGSGILQWKFDITALNQGKVISVDII